MSEPRKPAPTPAPLDFAPADHDTIKALGLTVMSYQSRATAPDVNGRSYWIPRNLAGADLALVLWCEANTGNYAIAGWEPQLGPHMHGGRYETLASALAWIKRAREIRDGAARDFLGA